MYLYLYNNFGEVPDHIIKYIIKKNKQLISVIGKNKIFNSNKLLELGLEKLIFNCAYDNDNDFINNYIDIVYTLKLLNQDNICFFGSDLVSKNRFTSPLLPIIEEFGAIKAFVDHIYNEEVGVVIGISPCLIEPIMDYTKYKNIIVYNNISYFDKICSRLKGKYESWKFYTIESLRIFYLVCRFHSKNIYKYKKNDKPTYIIKTFMYENSIKEKKFNDSFFPDLKKYLNKKIGKNFDIITIVQGFENRLEYYQKLETINDIIIPVEYYLKPMKTLIFLISCGLRQVFTNVVIPEKVSCLGVDISCTLRELMKSGGWRVQPNQLVYWLVGKQVVLSHNICVMTLTYENNPWENLLIKSIREEKQEVRILGYQHSVVPMAAAGMFKSPKELKDHELPDEILTTGPKTAEIISTKTGVGRDLVKASCALRYKYLHDKKYIPKVRKKKLSKVLVALEGVLPVAQLVNYVVSQAVSLPDITFVVRSHPVLNIEVILKELDKTVCELSENIVFSTSSDVYDDVYNSDVVLYWGTTVSVEAVMMGCPVIHFDRGDILCYDPLFELEDLHWRVSEGQCLGTILSQIENLEEIEFTRQKVAAQKYVELYFDQVTEKALKLFLPFEMRQ